jgi:hypothetical protein
MRDREQSQLHDLLLQQQECCGVASANGPRTCCRLLQRRCNGGWGEKWRGPPLLLISQSPGVVGPALMLAASGKPIDRCPPTQQGSPAATVHG